MLPALFTLSVLLFLGSLAAVPWMLAALPADYFTNPNHHPLERFDDRPALRRMLLVVKNGVGVVLLFAGLAMLVLPGQGLLTLLVALELLDFPGKFAIKRRVFHWPPLLRAANRLRARRGRPPFM